MDLLKTIGVCCILLSSQNSIAQSNDNKAIKEVITAFSEAGDKNDHETLNDYLDDNYRIVMNRLFGSEKSKSYV